MANPAKEQWKKEDGRARAKARAAEINERALAQVEWEDDLTEERATRRATLCEHLRALVKFCEEGGVFVRGAWGEEFIFACKTCKLEVNFAEPKDVSDNFGLSDD